MAFRKDKYRYFLLPIPRVFHLAYQHIIRKLSFSLLLTIAFAMLMALISPKLLYNHYLYHHVLPQENQTAETNNSRRLHPPRRFFSPHRSRVLTPLPQVVVMSSDLIGLIMNIILGTVVLILLLHVSFWLHWDDFELMKLLGALDLHILQVFICESAIPAAIGILIGMVTAIGIAAANATYLIGSHTGMEYLTDMTFLFLLGEVLLVGMGIAAATILITSLTGLHSLGKWSTHL
jgi:hypothetical protein